MAIFRLDQILGKQGSKAKDVYESKLSLASRIVKVERQVSKIGRTFFNEFDGIFMSFNQVTFHSIEKTNEFFLILIFILK